MSILKQSVPLSQPLGRGTVGQSCEERDGPRDTGGTVSLKALARKVLSRDVERDSDGTAAKNPVPATPQPWDTFEVVSQPCPMDDFDERAALVEYGANVPRAWAEG